MKAHTNPVEKVSCDYFTAKAIRNAIANELARRIHITDELIAAKEMADKAVSEYREAVRRVIDEQRGSY